MINAQSSHNLPTSHKPESAAQHLVARVPTARRDERVDSVLNHLFGQTFDAVDTLYVLGVDGVLEGSIRLEQLFAAGSDQTMAELANPNVPRVALHQDQEHAAAEGIQRGATSVAVVDDNGHFQGAVPARALLEILRREHVEDLHRLAGIQRETVDMQSALEGPPLRRARHRLPWLLVGLVGSMLAAAVMGRFERVLQGNLAVAFFVPTIVYLADAIGTQTEAIAIRGLSLSRLPLRRIVAGEIRTGLMIGTTLAAAAYPIVGFAFGNFRLAMAVSAAIIVAGGVATTIGLLLPWVFQRAGTDPALGSGPVATVIQDVLSLLVYLAIATLTMT